MGFNVKHLNKYFRWVKQTGKNYLANKRVSGKFAKLCLDHTYDGIKRRGEIAARYLSGIDNPLVTLPKAAPNMNHVWHIFALMTVKRDELQNHLLLCGIKTAVHYPIPPHLQQCYAYLGHKAGDFPIAERYANEELSLPIYNGMTDEDVDSVINAVNCFEG